MLTFLANLVAWSALSFGSSVPQDAIPVLLVSGANNHDWEWTTPSLKAMLEKDGQFQVDVTTTPGVILADPDALKKYRAFVLDYNGPRWGEAAEANFLAAVRSGTGVSIIHAANNAFRGWVEYETLVGLLWREGTGHGHFHSFDVQILDRTHPVTNGLPDLVNHPDELYHKLVHMHNAKFKVLATALSSKESGGTGEQEPMITVSHFGEGRVFHTPLGHVWKNSESTKASHQDPQFQRLVVRGTEWAATGEVTEGVNRLTAQEKADGWKLLFDGKSGDHWRSFRKETFPSQGWVIDDQCLHVQSKGGGGDIITKDQYTDFELSLEWRVSEAANSGIFYRVTEEGDTVWQTGPEYQVLDNAKHRDGQSPLTSAAALYGLVPAENSTLMPVGEFNRARIVIQGNRVQHFVNGNKVVDVELGSEEWTAKVAASKFNSMPLFGKSPRGHLALQDHGDNVWFRNIKIRTLDG